MSRNACNGKFGIFVEILPHNLTILEDLKTVMNLVKFCQIYLPNLCELAQYTETGLVNGFDIFDKFGKILSNC